MRIKKKDIIKFFKENNLRLKSFFSSYFFLLSNAILSLKKHTQKEIKNFVALRPQKRRRKILKFSFIICVLVPSFIGGFYYTFIASDRYVAGSGFSVRSMGGTNQIDTLGTLTGLSSGGAVTADSHMLLRYLKSTDILGRFQKDLNIREKYEYSTVDFLSRLNPNANIEEFVEYWKGKIKTTFDNNSNIITFEVEAFTPEDANLIASILLEYAHELLNQLSQKAQNDTMHYAESEVKHSEERLKTVLSKKRHFLEKENVIDPARSALIQIEILGALEKKLLDIKGRIDVLAKSIDKNAPSMKILHRQAEALEKQITEKITEVRPRKNSFQEVETSLPGLLSAYESLEIERNFAQQAYTAALTALETAYIEANRQQRYLAVYSTPSLPEDPLYPRRFLNIFLIFLTSFGFWAIGVLITYSVRDHLSYGTV